MFKRKQREISAQHQLHQAALGAMLDSLRSGDVVEITWLARESLIVRDEDGQLVMPAHPEHIETAEVHVEGGDISYGGEAWRTWLRSLGEDCTLAVKSIRILERAGSST